MLASEQINENQVPYSLKQLEEQKVVEHFTRDSC